MLGDVYLTLAWMAFQRLRYGSTWQREAVARGYAHPVVTLLRPEERDEEDAEAAGRRR